MNTESYQTKVFNTQKEAEDYGKGGIWYEYLDGTGGYGKHDSPSMSSKNFPSDVKNVWVIMISESCLVPLKWETSRWQLTGTIDKPTLKPSMHWVDQWHGFLTDGFLHSC